jgi:putative acetyltransferase
LAAAESIRRLRAQASQFSYPLFRKHGFSDAGTEIVDREGVTFTRLLVEKAL